MTAACCHLSLLWLPACRCRGHVSWPSARKCSICWRKSVQSAIRGSQKGSQRQVAQGEGTSSLEDIPAGCWCKVVLMLSGQGRETLAGLQRPHRQWPGVLHLCIAAQTPAACPSFSQRLSCNCELTMTRMVLPDCAKTWPLNEHQTSMSLKVTDANSCADLPGPHRSLWGPRNDGLAH